MKDDFKNIDPIYDTDADDSNEEIPVASTEQPNNIEQSALVNNNTSEKETTNTINSSSQEKNNYRIYTPIDSNKVQPKQQLPQNNDDTVTERITSSHDRGDYNANFNSDDYVPQYSSKPQNNDRPKSKHKFLRFVALFVVFVFFGGVLFGAGYGSALYLGNQLTPDLVNRTQKLTFDVNQIEPVISSTANKETSTNIVASIAKTAGPSVVTVTSTFDSLGKGFFSGSLNEAVGTGSGIIYELRNSDLLIITNHHVIEDAKSVEITFHDGTSLEADIIGYDSRMDLAVLSIPIGDLDNSSVTDITVATFGDSSKLEVGELAVAIGNPLGKQFSTTITAGVISAINRDLNIDGSHLLLIQTDAAINPGNSGGALVNGNGEVIGINTAKYVDESVEGMGFSIPAHIALPVISKIIESSNGSDIASEITGDKPFLGVKISNITEDIYNETGMPFGIYIVEVFENSAAEAAGIKAGDIIYSIDGQKLMNSDELFEVLSTKNIGDVINISLARGDEVLNLEATLTKYNDVIQE